MLDQETKYLNFAGLISSQVKTDFKMKVQLSKPTNQLAEIFHVLYNNRNELGFGELFYATKSRAVSQRISDWRKHGLEIPCKEIATQNKFGREITYGVWKLTESDRELGVKIYEKINKK